jgi:hypothetical protein
MRALAHTDISVKLQNLAIHVVVAEALSGALQQLNRFLSCPVLKILSNRFSVS